MSVSLAGCTASISIDGCTAAMDSSFLCSLVNTRVVTMLAPALGVSFPPLLDAIGCFFVLCTDETLDTRPTLLCVISWGSIPTNGTASWASNGVSYSDDIATTYASTPADNVFCFASHGLTDCTPLLWQMDT